MKRLIVLLTTLIFLFTITTPASASDTLRVYYAGPEGSVKTALELAAFTFVDDPAQADVFLLNGIIPDPAAVAARLEAGAGLVLFLCPGITQSQVETLLGFPVSLEKREEAVSLTEVKGLEDPLLQQIVWNGAPQVRERFEIITPVSSVQPLVSAYEDGSWVLWSAKGGKAFIFTAFLTDQFNPQIQDWA